MRKGIDTLQNEVDQLDFKKIPASCDVIVLDVKMGKDKNQKDCLFVTYELLNGKYEGKFFIVKYTTYHYTETILSLEQLGLKGFEKGLKLHLELKPFSMGFPRHLPTELL